MAYFGGYLFGKHKLCKAVSPKKTIEGSVCGFIFAVLGFFAAYYLPDYLSLPEFDLWVYIVCGILIGVFSQFGDLSASLIKRKYQAKDYGNLLPGHGLSLIHILAMAWAYFKYENILVPVIMHIVFNAFNFIPVSYLISTDIGLCIYCVIVVVLAAAAFNILRKKPHASLKEINTDSNDISPYL